MKVLYVGLARSLWLFDFNLMNPHGLSFQPVIDRLNEKYKFGKAPKNPLDLDDQKALSFKSGLFMSKNNIPVTVSLSIYSDGFVVDTTSSTDVSTEFLIEVTNLIANEYGLKIPTKIRKVYVSQLDLECDKQLIRLNPGLEGLSKFIDSHVKTVDENRRHFDCSGLSFWTEDTGKVSSPAAFKFERKISAPFWTNHYFSQAPLETHLHLEALEMLERLLTP
jgi:hypothetical protein